LPGDAARLQGTWHLAASEVEGIALAPALLSDARIVVAGDRFESLAMGAAYEGTFAIDPAARPKTFDMLITSGHAAGTRHAGIYKFYKDAWTVCLAAAGAPRPTKFACGRDGGFAVQTFRREPPLAPAVRSAAAETDGASARRTVPASPIDGEWDMVGGVFNGAPMAADMVRWCKRVTHGGLTTVLAGSNIMLEARFTLDRATRPWSIDYVIERGADKGKAQHGIAAVDGAVLRVCMSPPGSARPAVFESRAGDKRAFTTWRRRPG
jgi:uncharacterized protein (TIGR03067 family)